MEKIAIFGNRRQGDYLGSLRDFFKMLAARYKVCVSRRFALYIEENDIDLSGCERTDELPEDVSCVISIGGDGTFLRAAAWVGEREIPVLGINTGHLGYLAGFSLSDIGQVLAALEGKAHVSKRMLLEVSSPYLPEDMSPYVLNEVSVSKGDTTSMVSIRAYIDDFYLADYLADGLVVATPTGSTAYNLSVGGPILQPTLENVVIAPIAPHTLAMRPIVTGASSEVRLEISSRGESCHVGLDGKTFSIPAEGSELRVRRAPFMLRVMQPEGTDFAAVLRDKLGWGSR